MPRHCSSCVTEYVDTVLVCAECGKPTIQGELSEDEFSTKTLDIPKLKKAWSFVPRGELLVAASTLSSYSVRAEKVIREVIQDQGISQPPPVTSRSKSPRSYPPAPTTFQYYGLLSLALSVSLFGYAVLLLANRYTFTALTKLINSAAIMGVGGITLRNGQRSGPVAYASALVLFAFSPDRVVARDLAPYRPYIEVGAVALLVPVVRDAFNYWQRLE